MKIAVIGSNGQLGSDVVRAFCANDDEVHQFTHSDLELASADSVSKCLERLMPEIVVNTAAMHHVENCEREPEKAFAVNAIGARNLAIAARSLDAVLVHVSTDYVFDGRKARPYCEDDLPCPLNVYGNSKLTGEFFVRTLAPRHFVVRTSAIYGANPCRAKGGLNFIELMLKLARERGEVRVVDDEFVSPTPTTEIAKQIVALSRSSSYGLYHCTAEGSCSWYEFAQEIFALTGTKVKLSVAGTNEFPMKVPRPRYSILENANLKIQGLNVFRDWRDGLREYLEKRVAFVAVNG
jgi:dTDP-4-dehydrorhamnose reductase